MVDARFLAVFFGDSIVWGQGLREADKFSTQLVQWVNDSRPALRAFSVVKAHSGAIIGTAEVTADPGYPGEVPSPYPTIHRQVAAYAESDPGDVDLVVINGGINDVGIRNIFNPGTGAAELRAQTRHAFGTLLPALLEAVAGRFRSPHTRVLVLGYYPVVSALSQPPAYFGLGPAGVTFFGRVVANSLLFEALSDELIQQAVRDANLKHRNRFVWVKPGIKAEHAAFGPESHIFELVVESAAAVGQAAYRVRPSIGHPNERGAKAYFEALAAVLRQEYGF